MTRMAQATATAPSALPEQSISATVLVEVTTDLDTGQPTLISSSDPHLGDLQVVTAEQVREATSQVRATLAKAEALAAAFEAATAEPATAHATHTATEIDTGRPLHFTCMAGCTSTHKMDLDSPNFAQDITCISHDRKNTGSLRIGCGDDAHSGPVLSTVIQVDHFHPDPTRRVPYAAVEVSEDHFIETLDPDGLAAVIEHFDQRVAAMRVRHAELIRIRDEYVGRQA